jgi:hypothetical protein
MLARGYAPAAGDTLRMVDFDFDTAGFILISDIGHLHRALSDTSVAADARLGFCFDIIFHVNVPFLYVGNNWSYLSIYLSD